MKTHNTLIQLRTYVLIISLVLINYLCKAQEGNLGTYNGIQYLKVGDTWYSSENGQLMDPLVINIITLQYLPGTSQAAKDNFALQNGLTNKRHTQSGIYEYHWQPINIFTQATIKAV